MFLGDKEFKKQQSMSLLKELVQQKYIVQKEPIRISETCTLMV
jgi:hypothetical protein